MAVRVAKTLFTSIRGKRTFEEVSAEIKKMIFKGILKPGDKLPPESQLARQFNVGRQTVRESLRILELSGFITIQKGSVGGPIIQDTILNTISNSLFDALQMGRIKPTDVTIARLEIEKVVLSYAIDHIEDSDIKSIQNNIDQAKIKLQTNISPFIDNIDFHRLLAEASRNHVFVVVMSSIYAFIVDFVSRLEPKIEVSRNAIKMHQNILDAIIRKDKEEAITLLEKHTLESGKRFERLSAKLEKRRIK